MGAYETQGFRLDDSGRRVVVDPVTRIEGHMRCEVNLDADNVIRNAVSTGTMWRGLEVILKGRDPRDAWAFVERICGVCTGCHALASVRAVEDALGIEIPKNAYLIREMMAKTLQVHDHAVHFYHLHALDWVDVVSALKADPKQTSALQQMVSPSHPMSSPGYFRDIQNRLKKFVESGQLGPFMNGYWGNKAYVLPPEANLMAVTHYLEALDLQKEWVKVHTIFGGKNPHPNYLVGGVPCAINIDRDGAAGAPVNMERLNFVEARIREMIEFNNNVYVPDVLAIGTIYKAHGWLYGGGLSATSVSDYGTYEKVMGDASTQQLPGGAIINGNWDEIHPIDPRDPEQIRGVFGAGVNLNGRHLLAGATVDWVAGIERYRDSTDSRYRANLLDRQDTAVTVNGSSRISDRRMTFDTLAWFAQAEWAWRPWLRPSLGLRHDDFGGDCSRRGPETAAGGCGAMNDYRQTSPKLGLRSTLAPWLDLRASLTRGFQLPSDAAKYVEGGRVEPTTFRQREIGASVRLGRQALIDLAVFRSDSSNEIYLADSATATYANLGRSRREGVELELHYAATPTLDLRLAGTWFRTEVLASATRQVIGKAIPNVPRQLLTLGANWRPRPQWSTQLSVRRVGAYPVDAQNQWVSPGFTTVRLGLAHETRNPAGQRRRYYATIDNLFDRRFATSAGVTNGAWFYAPGAPRTLTVGVQADL